MVGRKERRQDEEEKRARGSCATCNELAGHNSGNMSLLMDAMAVSIRVERDASKSNEQCRTEKRSYGTGTEVSGRKQPMRETWGHILGKSGPC